MKSIQPKKPQKPEDYKTKDYWFLARIQNYKQLSGEWFTSCVAFYKDSNEIYTRQLSSNIDWPHKIGGYMMEVSIRSMTDIECDFSYYKDRNTCENKNFPQTFECSWNNFESTWKINKLPFSRYMMDNKEGYIQSKAYLPYSEIIPGELVTGVFENFSKLGFFYPLLILSKRYLPCNALIVDYLDPKGKKQSWMCTGSNDPKDDVVLTLDHRDMLYALVDYVKLSYFQGKR